MYTQDKSSSYPADVNPPHSLLAGCFCCVGEGEVWVLTGLPAAGGGGRNVAPTEPIVHKVAIFAKISSCSHCSVITCCSPCSLRPLHCPVCFISFESQLILKQADKGTKGATCSDNKHWINHAQVLTPRFTVIF